MRLFAPTGRWLLWLALAGVGDAAALSRAMWAEFNTIYLINLKPTAECKQYRTRSLDLLRNNSLPPDEVDAGMRVLWDEAKGSCLQPAPVDSKTAAKALTPPGAGTAGKPGLAVAPPVAEKTPAPSPLPEAAQGPPATPAAAPAVSAVAPAAVGMLSGSPGPPGMAGARPAPGASVLPVEARVVLPLVRPPIERPSVADLRLEAACAKRNPYAYQTQSDDDPCVRLARKKATAESAGEPVAPVAPNGGSPGVWLTVLGTGLAATGAAAALWSWRRRKPQPVPIGAANDAAPPADEALPARQPA